MQQYCRNDGIAANTVGDDDEILRREQSWKQMRGIFGIAKWYCVVLKYEEGGRTQCRRRGNENGNGMSGQAGRNVVRIKIIWK